ARIVGFVFERIADIAISIRRAVCSRHVEATAVILPRNVVSAEHIADTALHGLGNDQARLRQSLRCERGIYVYRLPVFTRSAFGFHRVWERAEIVCNGSDAGLTRIGTIEPLCP